VSSSQRKPAASAPVGIRVVSRGPPPLPATAPSGAQSAPVLIAAAPASAPVRQSLAPEDERVVQQAISASIAPLLRKQQELEVRLEREAAERQRLRDEVERLRGVATSLRAPPAAEPLPEMLDGARRGRRVLIAILVIVALILTATFTAMIVSQSR
jgi:hypothetical protein